MTKTKKKKKTELSVVKPNKDGKSIIKNRPMIEVEVEELIAKLKKTRKRVKNLEKNFEDANASYEALEGKHALLEKKVATLDIRTERMGIALRDCMRKLGVARPE
ncbi:MAG: hypothetical protein K1000chlam4_00906 [Chlamydiae bacterium]|nr:hypothetical protein [Chlamydiota bacterium]